MTTTKETNPKDAFGSQKVGLSCVPMTVVLELATAMREGAQKYGRYNWRESGVRSSVYFDAAIRHLFAWWEGEEIDPDSGISHLTKAIASLAVLRDGQMQSETQPQLFNDDRPVNHVKHLVMKMNTKIADPKASFRTFIMDLSPEKEKPIEDGCGNAVMPFPGMEDVEKRNLTFKDLVDRCVEETKKEVLEQFQLTLTTSGTSPNYDPAVTAINHSVASLTDAQLEEKIGPQKWWLVDSEYLRIREELAGLNHEFIAQITSALYSVVFARGAVNRIWPEDVRVLYNRLLVFITPLTEGQVGEVIQDLDQMVKWKREEQKKQDKANGPQISLASSAQFRHISELIHRTTMEAALQLREAFHNYEIDGFFFRKQENLPSVTLIMHKIADHAKEVPPGRVHDMFKAFAQDVEIRIETLKSYEDPLNCNTFKHIKNELVSHIDEWRREILVSSLRGTPVEFEDELESDWCEKVRLFLVDLTADNRELCLQELQKVAVGSQNQLVNTREFAELQNHLLSIPTGDAITILNALEEELERGVPFIPSRIEDKEFYQRLLGLLRSFDKESQAIHVGILRKSIM